MGIKQITPQRRLQAILRNDFKSFVIKVFQTVSNDTYLDNWHVDVVCNEIEQMINGKNTRLIVNLPPRNMKSIICSVALPAYLLGKNPHSKTWSILSRKVSDIWTMNMFQDVKAIFRFI